MPIVTRFLAGLVVQTILFTALIIGPAWIMTGDPNWPRGWLVVALLFVASLVMGAWLVRKDPGLLRERTSLQLPNTRSDGMATLLILAVVVGWFVAAAWDARVLHLIKLPGALSFWMGLAVFTAGLGLIVWMFRVNSFAAPIVKIQQERDHRVVDTGPYALVRHPMYLGANIFFAGQGLLLESAAAALIAVPLFALGFLPRIQVEEAVLRRDLGGYADYQSKVRARIVPWVF